MTRDLYAAVDLLQRQIPGVPEPLATSALLAVSPTAARILDHLESYPNALTSGDSGIPPMLAKLVWALHDGGVAGIRLPECVVCGGAFRVFARLSIDGRLCHRCYRNVPQLPDPARQLIELLGELLPDVSAEIVASEVARFDGSYPYAGPIVHYLARHPKALTSGSSSGPRVAVRFIQSLVDAGVAGVAAPLCAACSRPNRSLAQFGAGGRICDSCRQDAGATTCSQCGVVRRVIYRDEADEPWCGPCRYKDPTTHRACSNCGNVRQVVKNTKSGPICKYCYRHPLARCVECRRETPVRIRTESGDPICRRCYQAPASECGVCGRMAPLAVREHGGSPARCHRCYEQRKHQCEICGQIRKAYNRTESGGYACPKCAVVPHRICFRCGEARPANAITEHGPVCARCYHRVVQPPCRRCGVKCVPYENGACTTCVLEARLDDLFRHRIDEPAIMLRRFLATTGKARSRITWLRARPSGIMLRQIVEENQPITHESHPASMTQHPSATDPE